MYICIMNLINYPFQHVVLRFSNMSRYVVFSIQDKSSEYWSILEITSIGNATVSIAQKQHQTVTIAKVCKWKTEQRQECYKPRIQILYPKLERKEKWKYNTREFHAQTDQAHLIEKLYSVI